MMVAEEMMSETPNQESASPASTVLLQEIFWPRFMSRHLLNESPAETTVSPKSPSTWRPDRKHKIPQTVWKLRAKRYVESPQFDETGT